MPRLLLLSALVATSLFACEEPSVNGTPVRATLDDGQVLVGAVHTETLVLIGGLGTLRIPLEDVGEVVPVDGGHLADSGGNVAVWLRDGTELVGRWADPELQMGIAVAGTQVSVDLPVDELRRFQMSGGELWPSGELYRVRSTYGDDFLVDPERTTLAIDSSLGHFEPLLSECASARPVGDPTGPWRLELQSGTVLVGALSASSVTFALPHGPDAITVPLAAFASLERQQWSAPPAVAGWKTASPAADASVEESARTRMPGAPATARPAKKADGAWFSNDGLKDEREQQYLR